MASVFTSRVSKTIAVPHDSEHSVTIRKLAPRHLDQAGKASQRESLENLKELGGPAFLKELQSMGGIEAVAKVAAADPLVRFDRVTLIEKGVTAWSYDAPLTRASFEDLDDETADWLAREILRLSAPRLFQTDEEAEAAQKNA